MVLHAVLQSKRRTSFHIDDSELSNGIFRRVLFLPRNASGRYGRSEYAPAIMYADPIRHAIHAADLHSSEVSVVTVTVTA